MVSLSLSICIWLHIKMSKMKAENISEGKFKEVQRGNCDLRSSQWGWAHLTGGWACQSCRLDTLTVPSQSCREFFLRCPINGKMGCRETVAARLGVPRRESRVFFYIAPQNYNTNTLANTNSWGLRGKGERCRKRRVTRPRGVKGHVRVADQSLTLALCLQ